MATMQRMQITGLDLFYKSKQTSFTFLLMKRGPASQMDVVFSPTDILEHLCLFYKGFERSFLLNNV